MKQSKVTSMEVAVQAGVSQSAVSRAFTPGASVSKKTARKVLQVADQLGYRPNVLARAARTGKSRIVGLIVAYLDNQFYPESLQKLSERLQDEGYHILIFSVNNEKGQIEKTMQDLLDYQVDAIIAASVSLNNDLTAKCRKAKVPLVLYNRRQDDETISSVTSDNIAGAMMVAQHFADIGVQRPAYLAGWAGASTQRDREAGFMAGLVARDLTLYGRGIGDFDFEVTKTATRALFAGDSQPDAVFAANDHMAFAVMDVLRHELGLKVPEDVVVAGYDDVAISAWAAYDLTSVRQAANRMVDATVAAVMAHIENPDADPIHKQIEGPLIVRGSTRKT